MLKQLLLFLFCLVVLVLTVRGLEGNPVPSELNTPEWRENGPFELSPERGRFALIYSLVEDKSFYFSLPIARFATPDLGYKDGHYVSLFAPGVSFLTMPGYFIGKIFNMSQVGTFLVISIFGIINVLLIRAIAVKLGANSIAASIGGLVYLFATPSFAYAVVLYQHHISVSLLLLSIYLLLRWRTIWSLAFVWSLVAFSITIDYPNFFMMLPVGIFGVLRFFDIKKYTKRTALIFKPFLLLSFLGMVLPLIFFLWFNQMSYGNPLQLAGTVPGVRAIDEFGKPKAPENINTQEVNKFVNPDLQRKEAVNFFKTRNILNGLYVHLLSWDRGTLFYAPLSLLGALGLIILRKRNQAVLSLFLGIIGINILLYSMWGDPWGGWAFGSRYLIPTYSLVAVSLALLLDKWRKNIFIISIFFVIFVYSAAINTVAAITSNRNPPQIEILGLEKLTGREEKYTFARNFQYLDRNESKSFIFQKIAKNYLSAWNYYLFIFALVIGFNGFLTALLFIKGSTKK